MEEKNIDPSLCSIEDYLNLMKQKTQSIFSIPEYQRAYSWGIDNCDKLWQDIVDFVDNNSMDSYFFGTIIINCSENRYELIDGQQRTITFLLLLKALLVRINTCLDKPSADPDSEPLYRGLRNGRVRIMSILYKTKDDDIADKPNRDKDQKIYNHEPILINTSINELYKDELVKILSAVDFKDAENKVFKKKFKQKDNKYTNFFRNYKFFYEKINDLSEPEVKLIAEKILSDCEVIRIKSWQFEQAVSMFNSLNSKGLPLKNADMISARLYHDAEKEGWKDDFRSLWETLKGIVDDLEKNGIADMDELLKQYMYYLRARSGSTDVTTPGLRKFYIDNTQNELVNNPKKMCNDLLKLARIWQTVADYPFVKVFLKFNANAKAFLASYFCRFNEGTVPKDDVQSIVECLLRLFVILELVDYGYSNNHFKSFLFRQAVNLADENIPIKQIKEKFDEHIKKTWTPENIKEFILSCDKHVLVYLNEYLFAKEEGKECLFKAKCDIEHIMPQSGINQGEIKKDACINDDDEFRETVNKLGNKILLEISINRGLGDAWFKTKVSTTLEKKTGYINSEYPIANALVEKYSEDEKRAWTKKDIDKATEKASKRIVRFIFGE